MKIHSVFIILSISLLFSLAAEIPKGKFENRQFEESETGRQFPSITFPGFLAIPFTVLAASLTYNTARIIYEDATATTTASPTTTPAPTPYGIMVMGGFDSTAVELYNPETQSSCFLPDLPDDSRYSPVNAGTLVCGGGGSSDGPSISCVSFTSGAWESAHSLIMARTRSSIWDSSEGLVLLGGTGSDAGETAEILRDDLTSEFYFELDSATYDACSITDYDSDTVILTGGYQTLNQVKRYGHMGFEETLPDLNGPRMAHACSSYIKDGKQVLLVAGGVNDDYDPLSSTEIFSPDSDSAWTTVSSLPDPMSWTESITLNNKIYIFGNYDDDYYHDDYVHVWDGETEEWTHDGTLEVGRSNVGLSLVPLDSGIMDHCSLERDGSDEETADDSSDPNREIINKQKRKRKRKKLSPFLG